MIKNLFIFMSGIALGVIPTYLYMERKYEERLSKDIEGIRKVYHSNSAETTNEKDANKSYDEKEVNNKKYYNDSIKAYTALLNKDKVDEAPIEFDDEPYIISCEVCGDNVTYDKVYLTYYSEDGILLNDNEEEIDPSGKLPSDFADHFGEEVADMLYIQNDKLQTYYEIDRVNSSFYRSLGVIDEREE